MSKPAKPPYRVVWYRGSYAIRYTPAGTAPVRRSLNTTDRGEAEARAGEYWSRLNRPSSARFADLWVAYLADREKNGIKIEKIKSFGRKLLPHFGHRLGHAITEDDSRTYYAQRRADGVGQATARTELEYLRTCLNWSAARDFIPKAPVVHVPPPAPPREHYLTRDMVRKLLAHVDAPHARLFIILAVTTGARMGAILDLRWQQVNLDLKLVNFLPAGRGQNNKRRPTVPLNDLAVAALVEAQKTALSTYVIEYGGGPIKDIKKAIQGASLRSGVKCSAHVFRHTAGVWAAQAGAQMEKIAEMLGHTNIEITRLHYAKYHPEFLREVSSALTW